MNRLRPTFPASAHVTATSPLWAKASLMAEPKIKCGGEHSTQQSAQAQRQCGGMCALSRDVMSRKYIFTEQKSNVPLRGKSFKEEIDS